MYFARRREQVGRSDTLPAPLPPQARANARRFLDSMRQGSRPMGETKSRHQVRKRLLGKFGADLLHLTAAGRNAVGIELAGLRKRARENATFPILNSKRRKTTEDQNNHALAVLDRLGDVNTQDTNEMRVFDGDMERTPHVRRRTLPNNFLNSQLTNLTPSHDNNKSSLKRGANPAPSLMEPASKRLRGGNRVCDHSGPQFRDATFAPGEYTTWGNNRKDHRMQRNNASTIKGSSDGLVQTRPIREGAINENNRSIVTSQEQHGDHHSVEQRAVTRSYRFGSPQTSLKNARSPGHQSDLGASYPRMSPKDSNDDLDCAQDFSGNESEVAGVIPRATPGEDPHSHFATPREPSPNVQVTKIETGTLSKFPLVDIESDTDSVNMNTDEEVTSNNIHESIMSRQPFSLHHMSAELLAIEDAFFNVPDESVRAFRKLRRPLGVLNGNQDVPPELDERDTDSPNANGDGASGVRVDKENTDPAHENGLQQLEHTPQTNETTSPLHPGLLDVDVTISVEQNPVRNAVAADTSQIR